MLPTRPTSTSSAPSRASTVMADSAFSSNPHGAPEVVATRRCESNSDMENWFSTCPGTVAEARYSVADGSVTRNWWIDVA